MQQLSEDELMAIVGRLYVGNFLTNRENAALRGEVEAMRRAELVPVEPSSNGHDPSTTAVVEADAQVVGDYVER